MTLITASVNAGFISWQVRQREANNLFVRIAKYAA